MKIERFECTIYRIPNKDKCEAIEETNRLTKALRKHYYGINRKGEIFNSGYQYIGYFEKKRNSVDIIAIDAGLVRLLDKLTGERK